MRLIPRNPLLYAYTWMALLVGSCAQIASPTGGPRDAEAPRILQENPPNRNTRFEGKSIDIEFNEFIQVLNPQSVVISPEIDPQPDILAKKKQLHIKFKQALDSNITYTIFFGNAIGDINENNRLDNYSYVFSTGDFLDSLSVTASVVATEGDIPDNSYLLLYRENDDSAFLTRRPFYLTQIEKNGSARLDQLKAGTYSVYALTDKNINYYYDLPTEHIGFLDSAITVTDSTLSLTIPLFLPEESRLRITDFDKRIQGGLFRMTFNKPLSPTQDEIRVLLSEDTTRNTIAFPGSDNKQLVVYLPDLPTDSVSYTLLVRHNGSLVDSLRLRCDSRIWTSPVPFFTDTTALKSLNVMETQALNLHSPYFSMLPLDTARIMLYDSTGAQIPFQAIRDTDLCTYLFYAEWKDQMTYRLVLQDSALTDLAGNRNARQEIRFVGVSRKKAGQLILNIELPHIKNQAIILLKDAAGKTIRQWIAADSKVVKLDAGLLRAGSYQATVVDDVNNNGIWNSGNYATKTLPEKIFVSDKTILIKENWDAEETIRVDYTQVKKPGLSSPENTGPNNKPKSPFQQTTPGQQLQQD